MWIILSNDFFFSSLFFDHPSKTQRYSIYSDIRQENAANPYFGETGTGEWLTFLLKKWLKWLVSYQNSCSLIFCSVYVLFKILEPHLFKVFIVHLMTSCLQKVSQVTCGGRMQLLKKKNPSSTEVTFVCFVKTPIGSMTIWFSWGWRALDFVKATSST